MVFRKLPSMIGSPAFATNPADDLVAANPQLNRPLPEPQMQPGQVKAMPVKLTAEQGPIDPNVKLAKQRALMATGQSPMRGGFRWQKPMGLLSQLPTLGPTRRLPRPF